MSLSGSFDRIKRRMCPVRSHCGWKERARMAFRRRYAMDDGCAKAPGFTEVLRRPPS